MVPRLAPGRIRADRPVVEEQKLPACEQRTEIVREPKPVARRLLPDRLARHQERIESRDVFIRELRKMLIGEDRIKVASGKVDALAHRAPEGGLRIGADPGLPVRRYVGAVDRAERRLERPTTCERSAL